MCGLFGFLHYGKNKIKDLSNITNVLAEEAAAEERMQRELHTT